MWNVFLSSTVILVIIFFQKEKIKKFYRRVERDFVAIAAYLSVFLETKKVIKQNESVYKRFENIVKRNPNKSAILFEDETWTFAQIEIFANKVAIYFEGEGYKQGDCIALLLQNCPEYVCLWLGLSKIGILTSLLNTNLSGDSLIHSIRIINCKAIIYGSRFRKMVATSIIPKLSGRSYQFNRYNEDTSIHPNSVNLSRELNLINSAQPLKNVYLVQPTNTLFYMYTSGTTGLPKAAIVTHYRYHLFRCAAKAIFKNPENAVIYCPMPLHHGSGTSLGMGQMILWGATIVLREKFSASNYWADCKKYNCNIGQYIGEMLRYILTTPNIKNEDYSLDALYGNGLKQEIWKQFIKKFKVKRIFELYGSIEGTVALCNVHNIPGPIAYVPHYMKNLFTLRLIRFSEETGEPIRDSNGFCIECVKDEPGLAVAMLNNKMSYTRLINFKGYADGSESSKKILRNVFKEGDSFFNSGDLLSFDKDSYYYFVDRIGDTFRWKGVNVSTTEIESIISKIIHLNDVVVYGVQVPGVEGKAGMASLIDPDGILDVNRLLEKMKSEIPQYAIPLFLRIMKSLPLTSTYKLQKYNLRRDGFNVNFVKDPLYFFDVPQNKYIPLTNEVYNQILEGNLRL